MTPLEAVALVVLLLLPFHWLVQRELAKMEVEDPRSCGVVILREQALEARSQPLGEYMGHEIWATVTFRGLVYRFDRVQPPRKKEELAAGELFLDPGLVYVVRA
jgi:hypothetical protein